jgi:hypothetical protein
LLLRAARTPGCAGEGELVLGLTEHGGILPGGGSACQRAVFGRFWLGLPAKAGNGAGGRAEIGPEQHRSRAESTINRQKEAAWFSRSGHSRSRASAPAPRHTWADFLRDLPQSTVLKKSLASKISPVRCGYSGAFGLDLAA